MGEKVYKIRVILFKYLKLLFKIHYQTPPRDLTCDGLRAIIKLQVGHKKVINMDLKELICTK